jgi:hypothetical protein
MKASTLMEKIASVLEQSGLHAIAPTVDEPVSEWELEKLATIKRAASKRHMDFIRAPETTAILVVNTDRPEAQNYIGPNAFAEIGVAFSDETEIFLLQGMPKSYADELTAWGVRCLNGDLRPLLGALNASSNLDWQNWQEILRHELTC